MQGLRHFPLLAAWLFSVPAHAGLDGVSGWLELGFDDNLGSSVRSEQALSSSTQSLWLASSGTWLIRPRVGARLQLSGGVFRVEEYPGLSHSSLQLSSRIWWAASTAVRTNWLELRLASKSLDFDSELRDGREWRLSLEARRRFNHRGQAGIALERRGRLAASEVFSGRQSQISLRGDWRATPRHTVYGAVAWKTGQRASSILPPDPAVVAAAEEIVDDDVLRGYRSYRLEARSWSALLGWAASLSPRWGLDLRGQSVSSEAGPGLSYRRLRLKVSLLFQF